MTDQTTPETTPETSPDEVDETLEQLDTYTPDETPPAGTLPDPDPDPAATAPVEDEPAEDPRAAAGHAVYNVTLAKFVSGVLSKKDATAARNARKGNGHKLEIRKV